MKEINHFVKFIFVRVCQFFFFFFFLNTNEKSAMFITSTSVGVCVFEEKKKTSIKSRTF